MLVKIIRFILSLLMSLVPKSCFVNYSAEDFLYLDELSKHLSVLEQKGVIKLWNSSFIIPGEEEELVINEQLKRSDVVILLVSSDYLSDTDSSKSCIEIQKRAFELNKLLIPIIIRPCGWIHNPIIKDLVPLPRRDGKLFPVKSNEWDSTSQAFDIVLKGILRALQIESDENDYHFTTFGKRIDDKTERKGTLQLFKDSLHTKLDEEGFVGVSKILVEIDNSPFSFEKSMLTNLRNQATEPLARLTPNNFILSVRAFVDSIN